MRSRRMVDGLNNSQKIRVIVDGVGFYTTIAGTSDICTRNHRMAVQTALMNLSYDRRMAEVRGTDTPVGFGFNYAVPNEDVMVSVQVDLV